MSLWEAGLALVRSGETTMEELRRVAAEPVRLVAEPAVAAAPERSASPDVTRIAWRAETASARSQRLLAELREAAELLGESVQVNEHSGDATSVAPAHPPDAVIVASERGARPEAAGTLVVALAPESPASHHVSTLAGNADLVLAEGVSGRVLLATLLALLRWRRAR